MNILDESGTHVMSLFTALSPRKFSLGDDDLLQTARAKGKKFARNLAIHIHNTVYVLA